jgi:flagellar M-ring protein FliF
MNDFLKRIIENLKNLWGKWSMLQRVILVGIVVAVLAGIIALFGVSSSPNLVPVIDAPIRDQDALDRIVTRINHEGVRVVVSPAGLVQVADEATARRMRAILIREDAIPRNVDPWAIFDKDRWTMTDFERNVNFRRAQTQVIIDHIKALDEIDDVSIVFEVPERTVFASEQKPITASVIILPRPSSDITENRKKIEGIQKLLRLSVPGLIDDNIVIVDQVSGVQLNDFAGMAAMDRLSLIERENKLIQTLEARYRAKILQSLQSTFSPERVRDLDIKITMNMSKMDVNTQEILPIMIKEPTPGLPYDDSERMPNVPLGVSESTTKWEGTGYNPEGPAGVEGQTPQAYKDMSNLYGRMTQDTKTENFDVNRRVTQEDRSPQIDRVSVSVNIDGTWEWKFDEKKNPVIRPNGSIEREYTAIPDNVLRDTERWIQDAIGYSAERRDSVTVRNIAFDRTREFNEEDEAYFKKKQTQTTIIIFLSGLTLLLIAFIIFRVVAREMERRKRLAEEERARREQALRESAMMDVEQDGMEVSISVEERTRMELMESVVNMAKEHPEDCAQLIRTWLLEE